MGSLVPGWDSRRKVPRGFRDYEDPSPIPKDSTKQGPPNLNRASAPGRFYAVHPAPSSPRASTDHNQGHHKHHTRSLARVSAEPTSPHSPTSGLEASAFKAGSAPLASTPLHKLVVVERPHHLTAVLHEKEHWCDRMDSASLNTPVDDPTESLDVKCHGSFVPDDPTKAMHLLHIHSQYPKAGEKMEGEGEEESGREESAEINKDAVSPASVVENNFHEHVKGSAV